MNIGYIYALAIKEFLALLRDKRSRIIIIVPPLLQLFVFSYAATYDLNNIPVAIYNEDVGTQSREFVSHFQGSKHFHIKKIIQNEDEVASLINNRDVLMLIHIDQNFSANLLKGNTANVQLILDGRNSNTAMVAMNYVRNIMLDFNEQWLKSTGQQSHMVKLKIRAWYNENLQSRWFIVPGIVAMLVAVVSLLVTALSVAREREAGTFDQLLVTPLRPAEILVGKAVPGILIGLFESTLILILMDLGFDIPIRGDLGPLYLGLVIYIAAMVGAGLMISSIVVNQQQAILGAFLFLVPCVILSGFSTPIANMPELVQWLTYIDPLRYFLIIVRGVTLEGDGYTILFNQYWPMALIALFTLSMATWLFRNRMY